MRVVISIYAMCHCCVTDEEYEMMLKIVKEEAKKKVEQESVITVTA